MMTDNSERVTASHLIEAHGLSISPDCDDRMTLDAMHRIAHEQNGEQPDEPETFASSMRDPVSAEQYSQPAYIRFVADMKRAGLTPYHYHGRFFYEGPAVDVDDLQDALSETRVKCQWDNMGLGFVVYPKEQ